MYDRRRTRRMTGIFLQRCTPFDVLELDGRERRTLLTQPEQSRVGVAVAPEQAGALPQSGGLLVAAMVARRRAAGAFPYRTHNRTRRRARHAQGRARQKPSEKVSCRPGKIAGMTEVILAHI